MKKHTLVLGISCLLTLAVAGQSAFPVPGKVKLPASPFPLSEVRLLDGPFKRAMQKDMTYLLSLEPDCFLHRFRENAGLPVKGAIYGGWEEQGVSGHSLGHYLSACSIAWAATGDIRFKQRTDYIVQELALCQQARKTGYVGGIPDEDKIFNEVAAGDIRSQGFDLNGGWVPWYTEHKVLAGLIDAWRYAGSEQAKAVAVKFADWIDSKFKRLTTEQFQRMLNCEHGGMNESLADIYGMTGNKKYLALSYRFHHHKILDPLAQQEDKLGGLHANTQIPKVIGTAQRYELTGDTADKTISNFFWDAVVHEHTYVIGGNSNNEQFNDPGQFSNQLGDKTTETCNTYNMLKLTRHLFSWKPSAAYMDYYERALYNHILASQDPDNGMTTYYVPLVSGGIKTYCTPANSFWCCTGTGMENHVKYGESIYFKGSDGSLYVNLFIPSVLAWQEKGLVIRQETGFPEEDIIRLKITGKGQQFPLKIRYPVWAQHGVTIKVNGKTIKADGHPGSYITITRNWKANDEVSIQLPMSLHTEAMPDNASRVAVLYGPLVLSGELGAAAVMPEALPVLISNNRPVQEWIQPVAGKPLTFRTSGVGRPQDISLIPFYRMHHQHYIVYWDYFTPAAWRIRQQQFEAARKQQQLLEASTTDYLRPGEMQPERDHRLKGEKTDAGEAMSRHYRHATDGGWFSFEMNTAKTPAAELICTYWGSDDGNRTFDILADGALIATERLDKDKPGEFFDRHYNIPAAVLKDKSSITITFRAHPGNTAGGLFGCRVVRVD